MTRFRPIRRLFPALFAGLSAAALLPAADARAQDTIPAVRQDSAQIAIPGEAVRGDTIPDTAKPDSVPADSTLPAPNFPEYPKPRQNGFGAASWVFGPAELSRFHGLTLLDLLDRIPGLVITREGGVGRAAGIAAFSSGGGRFRVFLDGWELRPLNASVLDLQQVPLVDITEVRVTRGLTETRVDLETLRLTDRRPFAQIEGGEGDFATRLLRGIFARPLGKRWLVQAGVDLVETAGFRRAADFSENTAMARLSYAFAPDRALELEYRSTGIDTERRVEGLATQPPTESYDRGEFFLRGRGRFFGRPGVCADTTAAASAAGGRVAAPGDSARTRDSTAAAPPCARTGGLWLDGAVGRSWLDPLSGDSVTLQRESVQAMLRATVDIRLGTLTGAARFHRVDEEGFSANATELSARAELTPRPWIAAWGEARAVSHGGVTGVELEASGRAGPFGGFTLFGSVGGGNRALRFRRDSTVVVRTFAGEVRPDVPEQDTLPVVLFREAESVAGGFRAGAEWTRGSIRAGAAFVAHDLDVVSPFGFWFERGLEPRSGGTVGAVEAYVDAPVLWPQLRFQASYTDFLTDPERPYLPQRFGRAALEYHGLFFNGNFEPTFRSEVLAGGKSLTINPETGVFDTLTEPYATFNFYVQLRVLDVRAFWRMENAFNRDRAFDVPNLFLPGVRTMFGVRWFFRD
ncbi:MAG TPA: Plug domain-containing protein [Longimicrobium sp.]|nr:Plug domain-containing protein [Longimicrobium sp.]